MQKFKIGIFLIYLQISYGIEVKVLNFQFTIHLELRRATGDMIATAYVN
ncbi:MAG: hypothetical protein QNJ47_27080 [Nostocaceae cyanobacterium]|nr:hypothetical protein [Nostocaceae cyanobacterium]